MNESAGGRVRVLPNRNTVGLIALLSAMWYAGASQNNGAAYLLGFTLASVAVVSVLHAGSNLRGLRLSCAPIAPVFAGEPLRVRLFAHAAEGRTHIAVRFHAEHAEEAVGIDEVRSTAGEGVELRITTERRGHFGTLRIKAASWFPLGFFSAQSIIEVRQPHYVYPKATGSLPLPYHPVPARHRGSGVRTEGDDFAGLRAYMPGEPQRHIDWKAAARGQGLFIKQWAGEADDTLLLDWADTASLPHEARLSQLARWCVLAERSGHAYRLALPGLSSHLTHGRGESHLHQCLRALAIFPTEETPR